MSLTNRYLVSRGFTWLKLRTWKIQQLSADPNILTCQQRAELSACLTADEAARVAFRFLPGAEIYMWDEPDWIPTKSTAARKAVRIVATVTPDGRHAVQQGL